jgi:hypothetical protein
MGKPLTQDPPPPPPTVKGRMVGGVRVATRTVDLERWATADGDQWGLTEDKCRVVRGARVVSGMSGGDVEVTRDLMSFKHVIAGAVEGGLDPDRLWARNPPQAATRVLFDQDINILIPPVDIHPVPWKKRGVSSCIFIFSSF